MPYSKQQQMHFNRIQAAVRTAQTSFVCPQHKNTDLERQEELVSGSWHFLYSMKMWDISKHSTRNALSLIHCYVYHLRTQSHSQRAAGGLSCQKLTQKSVYRPDWLVTGVKHTGRASWCHLQQDLQQRTPCSNQTHTHTHRIQDTGPTMPETWSLSKLRKKIRFEKTELK